MMSKVSLPLINTEGMYAPEKAGTFDFVGYENGQESHAIVIVDDHGMVSVSIELLSEMLGKLGYFYFED